MHSHFLTGWVAARPPPRAGELRALSRQCVFYPSIALPRRTPPPPLHLIWMGVAWPSTNALTLPYLPSLRPLRPLRSPLSPTPPPPPPAPLLPPPLSPESECLEEMSRRREGYRGTMWGSRWVVV